MGLKELQSWNLIRLRHLPNDRRDYFTTPDDVWEIVRTLVSERKKRELDPTLTTLRALQMQKPATEDERVAQSRIAELGTVLELLSQWYSDIEHLETRQLVPLVELGAKVQKLINGTGRVVSLPKRRRKSPPRSSEEG